MTETTVHPSVDERVAAGAAWLDEHRPDWWKSIDLGRLDMSSSCLCVLGQVFSEAEAIPCGDFYDGDEDFWTGFDYATEELGVDDRGLGFNVRGRWDGDRPQQFAQLDAAWRALIAARREGESR